MDYINIILISLVFGIFAKYADLINEHKMPSFWGESNIFSGLIWGSAGLVIFSLSPLAGLTYLAHVLYWYQRAKLDYPNHATAGIIIILGAIFFYGDFVFEKRNDLVLLFLAYSITGYIQLWMKQHYPNTISFWRLRLRIYFISLVYSIIYMDYLPFVSTVAGMLGTEYMTIKYQRRESWGK